MRYRSVLAASAFLVATASAVPAYARVDVDLNFGPPPVRVERVPPPRAGYTWAPGYWDYNNSKHVWRGGHWERDRAGEHWHNGGWVEHDGKWRLDRGGWQR